MCGSSASPSWRIVSQRFGQGGLRDKDARRARGGCREGRKREEVILDFGSKKRDVRDGEGSELGARRRPRFPRNPPERALFGVSSRAPRERGELFPPLGGSVAAPSRPAAPPATPLAPASLPSAPSTCHGRSCPAFLAMSLTDHTAALLQKHTHAELSLPSETVRNVRTLTQKTSRRCDRVLGAVGSAELTRLGAERRLVPLGVWAPPPLVTQAQPPGSPSQPTGSPRAGRRAEPTRKHPPSAARKVSREG